MEIYYKQFFRKSLKWQYISVDFLFADNQSVGTGHNVANPSIGPSIGDASLGMTSSRSASGSHLERIGIIRDEGDTASTRAIGGMSLNGSICEGASLISAFQSK